MADKEKLTARVVDFSNVKDGGGSFNKKRIPAGDYLAKVVKVQDAPSKKDEVFQYLFSIKVDGYSQYTYPYYCKLQENQLWKLRNLLVAAGINVPKKRTKVDPSKAVGKTIGVTMEDDEYEGKTQSVVASVFPAAELADGASPASDIDDDGEDDEQEPQLADAGEEEEEEEEEEETTSGDEFDDMDRAELKRFLTKADPSFKAKKSQSDDDLRALARAVEGKDEDDDDDLEELDISDV